MSFKVNKPHKNQIPIIKSTARNIYLNCARRFGKTTTLEYIAVKNIVKGFPVGYFTNTYKTADIFWNNVKEFLEPLSPHINNTKYRLSLNNGGEVECWSLENKNAGRSRKYKLAIVDEIGLIYNIQQVLKASIYPTLIDLGGNLIVAGTPNLVATNKPNWEQLELWEFASNSEDWEVFNFSSYDNPILDPAEIRNLEKQMVDKDVIDQEIYARFITKTNVKFVTDEVLRQCEIPLKTATMYSPVVVALDAATDSDTFAMSVVAKVKSGYEHVETAVWVPDGTISLNHRQIYAEIKQKLSKYKNVVCVTYDPWQLHFMSELIQDDYFVERLNQSVERLKADMSLFEALQQTNIFLPEDSIGVETVKEHLDNAQRSYDSYRRLRMVKTKQSKKIDAAVALSMAHYKAKQLSS